MFVGYFAMHVEEVVQVILDDVVREVLDDDGSAVRAGNAGHLDGLLTVEVFPIL